MTAVPVSCTIQVDLQVSRYQEFPEDGMVQVWGHAGDYEVSVWLPIDDERVRLIRSRSPVRPSRKRADR
jgi:hypothetical protein